MSFSFEYPPEARARSHTPSSSETASTSSSEKHPANSARQNDDKSSEPWRAVGDNGERKPYKYPIPKYDGNPWAGSLQTLSERDATRCKAWVEEVQNLLIFAGLFSAVVTAFVVESYRCLQQDPNQVSADMLLRIVSHLEGTTNGTAFGTFSASESFSPSDSTVRVNVLWFLSLVFSLTTVLIGIVCSQWLREHQLPTQAMYPTHVHLSMRHMYVEALEKWYVPQIFAALPVLLQIGLILFLVGLIDFKFLWNLNHVVAAPIIAAIGLTFLFLLLTTCLPAFQEFTLYFPNRSPSQPVRSPCPYRSPQSWAYLQATAPIWRVVNKFILRPFQGEPRHSYGSLVNSSLHPDKDENFQSWSTHGKGWVPQRTIDSLLAQSGPDPGAVSRRKLILMANFTRGPHIPPYDCVLALSETLRIGSPIPAYDCFTDFLRQWRESSPLFTGVYDEFQDYLSDLLPGWYSQPWMRWADVAGSSIPVKEEMIMRSFFSVIDQASNSAIRQHNAELCIRIARAVTAQDYPISSNGVLPLYLNLWQDIQGHASMPSFGLQVIEQVNLMLVDFFKFSSSFHPDEAGIGRTTLTSPAVLLFIRKAVETSISPVPEKLTVKRGSSGLDEFWDTVAAMFPPEQDWNSIAAEDRPDYLFLGVSCYIHDIPRWKSDDFEWVKTILPALKTYRNHLAQRNFKDRAYLITLASSMNIILEFQRVWNLPHSFFRPESGTPDSSPAVIDRQIGEQDINRLESTLY